MADPEKDKKEELIEEPEKEVTKPQEPHKKKEKKKPSIEDKLEAIEEELTSIKDKYLRTLAEMENLQRRTSEEIRKERKYAAMTMADKLIDHIEVFDQALKIQTEDKNFQNFLSGFRMIKEMIVQSLESEGVKVIVTEVGKVFDPLYEHAVDTRYEPDKAENTVLEVVKKGYLFKDRLLRAAMVVINIKPETEPKEIIDETVA